MSSTTGGTAAASTKDEYDALLKEILESDSSEDERYRTLILSSRNHRATSPVLGFDPDTDLADIHPVSIASFSKSSVPLSPPTPTTRTKAVAPHANISSPPISITIGAGTPGTPGSPHRTQNPHLLSTSPPKDNNSSLLLPLSSPSSVASSPSSSLNTLTRASSIGSSSVKSGYNQPYNSIHFLASRLTEEPFPVSSAIDVEVALEYPTLASNYLSNLKSFKQRERAAQASTVAKKIENHHQSFIQRHEQRLSRYNQRTEALQRNSSAMESNRKSRENGHRNGRDSSSTIPIVLKGSNGRLVNGLQSITSLEQKFNELRIQELDLLNTPESTIKAVLADIYKISEELHMHLQGGPLSDAPRQGRKEGDGIIISGESQRQKRIKDILDRIVRETSLYEEFVRKSTYLSLDAILNEASDEDEELQGFGNLGRDMSDIDSTSDVHREDTLSQTSLMSGNHYGHTNSPSLPNSPLSSLSFRSIEPNHRLRPHPLSHGGPGSVASSSAITGRHSRASSVSFSVTGITPSETHSPDPGVGAEPWETFRWTPLLKLSDQLFSDEIKASSGLGTCIAVSNIIAIGTSRGSVLVYSTTQTLIGIYGNPQYALEHGSVCSISISSDHSYMVAGHSLGSIIVWNINKPNAPSRIIPPVTKETALSGRKIGHIRGSAVLSVAFVGIKRAEVVSADDQLLIVCVKPQPQTLFKFLRPKDPQSREGETNVALSGNLAWFPTTKSQRGPNNETMDTSPMLAFSWNRHLYIVQVGKAVGAANGSGSGAHLSSERKPVEANGKSPRLEFVNVGDWICREGIVGIQWVRPQILLLLTNTEDIIVFDPKAMCETERCSARSLQIVYHDWFKDVVRSHVTAAAANIPLDTKRVTADMCYNSSWKVHKGKLFVLGVRRVQVGTILNWTDRILALVKSGDFLEGIALATLFYTGKSVQAAVVGLPEDEASRKQVVGEKIYELLTASLNYTFNPERMMDVDADAAAGGVGAGTVLFHDLAIQAIESCLAIEDQAFLFEDVYERYGEASINVRGIFLQSMEGYILQDRLTEMPPQVMQAFVKYYSDRGMFKELELCICHTLCHVLEMDQIVDLCQKHQLYTALIYVWNKSIGDYVSPVVELLKVIKTILRDRRLGIDSTTNLETPKESNGFSDHGPGTEGSEDKSHQPKLSNDEIVQKLYNYLSDSLLGKSYIDGTLLEEQDAITAKVSLYSFIFSGRCVMWPPVGGKLILTGDIDNAEESEPTYPYLRLFLRHDCEEFLKVMDLAFEDSYLSSTSRDFSQMSRNGQEGPGRVMSRQLIINTLLEVLTPSVSFSSNSISDMSGNSSNDTEDEYTARDIAHLYSFVARAYARSPKSLVLSPTTLHRILTRLSSDTDLTTREERQIAVQALLRCYTPSDESGMMDLYEQAGFYRVLEKMHRSQKQFGPMIVTFLRDPERRPLVFEAIRKLLDPTRPQRTPITEKQRTDIVKTAMEHIAEIVDIDGEQAALLVHKYLNAEHRSVLETLHGSKPRLFAYLRGLLEPSNKAPEKRQLITEREAAGGLSVYMDNTELSPTGGSSITDPEIHEQYVELLCQYDPSGVYDYLERHQDNSYRLERVLKTCENAGVVDAVVWILERSGNVGGALGKVLDIVQERIDMLSTLVKSKSDGKIQDAYWTLEEQSNTRDSLVRLRGVLNVGKQLCERRSQKAKLLSQVSTAPLPQASTNNESDTETLWFRLLQAFVAASRKMTFLIASGKGGSADQVEGDLSTQGSNANKAVLIENAPPALFSNSSPESQYSYNVTDQLSNNFKGFVQSILATLLLSTSTPQVSLPSLLRRLLRSESSGDGDLNRFSDFKDIFLGMLDTFKYEGQLLEMTNGLFERDLFMGVQLIAKTRARGWRPRKGNCEICGGAFWGPNIVRELWVQQQKAAASAIKAALSTNVNGTTPEPSSENASSPESRTETPDIKATVPENKDKDKEKNGSDKDLLLFRCGHGYHRQCLEMESSALLTTSGQRLSTSETLDFDAAKTLNCAVCNGLVTVRKSRSTSSHRNSPSHRAGRSSRTSKSNNWAHLDTPQPTSSPRRTPRIVVSPSPPTVPGTAGRSLNNRSNGSSEGYGHPVENGDSISRPQTPVNRTQFSQDEQYPTSYNSSSYESPGPGGYQNSNEYEAATSPSMRASHNSKGKQKAAY
ncbi:Vacuolar protein sorting-associated protein 8 [Podila verticillata]|nr:Vacuolar protein sorting-associated protein 8 [Podila verticillata]